MVWWSRKQISRLATTSFSWKQKNQTYPHQYLDVVGWATWKACSNPVVLKKPQVTRPRTSSTRPKPGLRPRPKLDMFRAKTNIILLPWYLVTCKWITLLDYVLTTENRIITQKLEMFPIFVFCSIESTEYSVTKTKVTICRCTFAYHRQQCFA